MWINCAAPKTKNHPCIISCSKRIQSSVISREEHSSYFFGPWKCASHVFPAQWKHTLPSVTVVQLRFYRRPYGWIAWLRRHDLADNARRHTANWTCDPLWCCGWEVMGHPLYGPDLTAGDFYFFWSPEKHMADKWFVGNANIKQAVIFWLHTLDTNFFIAGIQAFAMVGQMFKWQWWPHRVLMCTICYPCATYMLKSK